MAPHRYGSPICFLAVETALAALAFCRAALAILALTLTYAVAPAADPRTAGADTAVVLFDVACTWA
ncbi:hypothetical protein Pve01_05760 [Planomonospora venezuelensis]|nr:hypothetical protein Pve01_05760 [Planomonospora venezuelensis]